MTIDEIKQEWLRQSEKMSEDVMRSYHNHRIGSGGREGLGIYGIYQTRIAKKKVQIAVKLLKKYDCDLTVGNIQKVTKQSRSTILNYFPSQLQKEREHQTSASIPKRLVEVIPLRPTDSDARR